MANFKCVNWDGKTIWIDIEKVLYLRQPSDSDNQMRTTIKLVTGEYMTFDENYQELLEDWGILSEK